MALKKKHRFRKPQIRIRQKETVGRLELVDVVYMDKEVDDEGTTQIFAACTCGDWRSSPEATTIAKVAMEAKAHVEAGPCMFRQHVPGENPYEGANMAEDEISPEGNVAE